jgi:hypothetical protein
MANHGIVLPDTGGAMMATAKNNDAVKKGETVILLGLGVQIIFFALFIVAIVVFHMRIRDRPTNAASVLRNQVPWHTLMLVLYATSLMIMVRSIFRIAEYAQGSDGSLQGTESYIYIFDATLMWITSALFNWFHPSRVINRETQDMAAGGRLNRGWNGVGSSDGLEGQYDRDYAMGNTSGQMPGHGVNGPRMMATR